jgi:hypothetical protein
MIKMLMHFRNVVAAITVAVAGINIFQTHADPLPPSEITNQGALSGHLKVRLSWGHKSDVARPYQISFSTNEVAITELKSVDFEAGDTLKDGVCETHAGGGDVDGVQFSLVFDERNVQVITNLQKIWAYLFENSDADTTGRLRLDPGFDRIPAN